MAVTATDSPTGSSPRWEGNLPVDLTSFVGRRREVAEVKRVLSQCRLVTLTGIGGVGKTRLALRVAAGVRRSFEDGVWLADLAKLSDPSLLAETVSEALEIRDKSARPGLDILADHLTDRTLLLVLDNCEHLVEDCATLAGKLLASCPGLRILATSRQSLNLPDERVVAVPPLSLPDSNGPPIPVKALTQFEAVALFTERAAAAQREFTLTEQNQDAVVTICRRLDGLPLAIELAVVRLRTLSPQQILERLADQDRLLTTGSRTVAPRHQTLRRLIDWSYELCSPPERLLWARSSVFVGSFDLEAARVVCSGEGIPARDVAGLVEKLVDKSILISEEGDPERFRQLETIRQYGRQRLAAEGGQSALRRRHRDHYQELAAMAGSQVFGPHQIKWCTLTQLNHDDLRAALEFCRTEPGEWLAGLRLVTDLLYHWITSYFLNEGRNWLDRMLSLAREPTTTRADALWANSWLAIIQGDIPSAKAMLSECGELSKKLEAERPLGYWALFSGFLAMYTGDARTAVELYAEAIDHHRAVGNDHGVALTLIRLSLAHSYLGNSAEAIAFGEKCVAACDVHGDIWHKSYALMALGIEVWRQGDSRRATALERESLVLNQSLNDRLGMALNIEVLAWIAADDGMHERAAELLGILRTHWRSIGAPLSGYGHLAGYHNECESRTRDALGETRWRTVFDKGSRLTFEQAVAHGLQDRSAVESPERDNGALTRREREIAKLVATGRSNKEIAATLVISQRTAEAHVANILAKLGFTSRAQVADWFTEHRTP